MTDTIREIHQRSRRTYGAPRIHGQLCRLGTRVGRKRVARLMAQEDLVGVHTRKKWRRGPLDVAPAGDLLKRNFSHSRPNERWVADITEFSTGGESSSSPACGTSVAADSSVGQWATDRPASW